MESGLIYQRLKAEHPYAHCELDFKTPFQLLVSVILSAQCTDKRVNLVTPSLFAFAPSAKELAEIPQEELEKLIFSCGFYRNKAKNLLACAREILEKYGGEVPCTHEELSTLPGVGRKTANVVLNVAFSKPVIAVDTHVFRVSRRLGLSGGKTPDDVERDLSKQFDDKQKQDVHHLLIFHGRYCCAAQKPACQRCPVSDLCPYYKELSARK